MRLLYVGGPDSAQLGAVGTHTRGVLNACAELGVEVSGLFLDDQVPDYFYGSTFLVKSVTRPGYYKKFLDRLRIAQKAKSIGRAFDWIYSRYDPGISPIIAGRRVLLEYNDDFLEQIDFAARSGEFSGVGAA